MLLSVYCLLKNTIFVVVAPVVASFFLFVLLSSDSCHLFQRCLTHSFYFSFCLPRDERILHANRHFIRSNCSCQLLAFRLWSFFICMQTHIDHFMHELIRVFVINGIGQKSQQFSSRPNKKCGFNTLLYKWSHLIQNSSLCPLPVRIISRDKKKTIFDLFIVIQFWKSYWKCLS